MDPTTGRFQRSVPVWSTEPNQLMAQPIVQVDSFTSVPFRGNPAGVCVLESERDAVWMQDVAREMNVSETAFLRRREDGDWDLRWFTPAMEVDLCGHATLAGAHVLWEEGHLAAAEEARFHTLSGLLTCRRGEDGWIEMDFPAEPATESLAVGVAREGQDLAPQGLYDGLGVEPLEVWRNRMDLLVVLERAEQVQAIEPDQTLLGRIETRGIMVTAHSDEGDAHDFVSRFFAPASGVPEDPVTGSAHCCLGPYWAERLGRDELVGYQASARGGVVRVKVAGDRVLLGGQAVTVLRGELLG